MLRVILAIILLVVSTPALAQAPSADQTNNEIAAQVQQGLQAFIRRTEAYDAIVVEASELALSSMDRIEEASELAETGARRTEIKRWSDGWIQPGRVRFAELERNLKALPPISLADFERLTEDDDPTLRQLRDIAKDYRTSSLASLQASRTLFETIAKAAPPAATGDEKAMQRLGIATFEGARNNIEAENALLSRSMLLVGQDHPQYWLLRSIVGSNKMMAEIFNAAVDEALEPDFETDAHLLKMAELIRVARSDADQVEPAAIVLAARLRTSVVDGTDLGRQIDTVLSSYRQSGEVELKICDVLEAFILQAKKEDSVLLVMETGLVEVETLADERLKVDQARRATLTQ